jgi:DNA-binding LacI/PurR family transcriptional regulator
MRLPVYEIGHRAVRKLMEKIERPLQSFSPIVLPFEHATGETVGAPPKGV